MKQHFDKVIKKYHDRGFEDIPNIFAKESEKYFTRNSYVLNLGDGLGQDARYFANKEHTVVSTDFSEFAVSKNKELSKVYENIEVKEQDLTQNLEFEDNTFDVVYAHQSIHYFTRLETLRIFNEINRVLKDGGIFCTITNPKTDPEFGTGNRIEEGLFETAGTVKRFMDNEDFRYFGRDFEIVLNDNQGQTYKDNKEENYNLTRFIGRKVPMSKIHQHGLYFGGAILERTTDGEKEVLIQTRWKPYSDRLYSDTIEIPVGSIDAYEDPIEAVKREVLEETGYKIKNIKNNDQIFSKDKKGKATGFTPFISLQQIENGLPWNGFIVIADLENPEDEPVAQSDEVKDIRWIKVRDLRELFEKDRDKFFTLIVPAIEKYLKSTEDIGLRTYS